MPRLSSIKKFFQWAALFPFIAFSAAGTTSPLFFSQLPIVDTLVVFLGNTPVGSLVGCLKKTGAGVENGIRLSVEVDEQTDIGKQRLLLEEIRRYDTAGALIDARQEMHSAAGTNVWRLAIDSLGGWRIAVTAAGVTTTRQVGAVSENISMLASLYSGLLSNTLNNGTSWIDTSIELTSGEPVISETRCVELPADNNDGCWVFECSNSVLQRREIWKVDKKGKTLYRDMYPYIGRKKGAAAAEIKKGGFSNASLFEMMKVKVPREIIYGRERVAVSFDNNQPLDPTVAMFFSRRGSRYIFDPLPEKCSETGKRLSPDLRSACLVATPTLQTTHPKLRRLADSLYDGSISVCELIHRYNRYVYTALRKRSSPTFSSALETLEAGYGDCGEHAVLLAALLRASGIPARVVMGLLYSREGEGYFYHAWVMAYAGQWIFADPSHGCFPAYKDRIPLIIDDEGTKMTGMAKIVGRVRLRYVEK
ncbi:MAG: transglutaminase domain-containing protein [Chitinispirillaceae bacterium]|nr:transglutaminase domain-containing protein [Chitinispirillaceae bacterium]